MDVLQEYKLARTVQAISSEMFNVARNMPEASMFLPTGYSDPLLAMDNSLPNDIDVVQDPTGLVHVTINGILVLAEYGDPQKLAEKVRSAWNAYVKKCRQDPYLAKLRKARKKYTDMLKELSQKNNQEILSEILD